MRQVFDEREIDELERETERERETELTLGSTAVLMILGGLVLFCGLCFGLGYAAGRHGSAQPAAAGPQPQASADMPLVASGTKQKPSAAPEPIAPPMVDRAAAEAGSSNDPDADVVAAPNTAPSAAQQTPAAQQQAAVKPAFAAQATQPQPSAGSAFTTAAPQGIVVQIAAVSHVEDAEVLVNALRRRGYTVTARRDLADSLIHVQVGPFINRNDANAMRVKLLNDGYNAIVEP
jgi:DedD protein